MSEQLATFLTRLIGEKAALRMGFYEPEYISKDNMVVFGYVESVDGALRRGESPASFGETESTNQATVAQN